MHGLPPSLIQAIQAPTVKEGVALQNSVVGNGFHMPSLMLALLIAFQLIPGLDAAQLHQNPIEQEEQELRVRVSHTAFDSKWLSPSRGSSIRHS